MKDYIKLILIILVISLILVFPIKYLSNFIHETGHINVASKYGINLDSDFSIKTYLSGDGSAKATPETKEDCEKFNNLTSEHRKEILHAGVYYQTLFLLPVIILITSLVIIFRKKYYKNKFLFLLIISIVIVLSAILLTSIIGDVFIPNPSNDWYLKFLDCSNF
jgi:hypothetical protein